MFFFVLLVFWTTTTQKAVKGGARLLCGGELSGPFVRFGIICSLSLCVFVSLCVDLYVYAYNICKHVCMISTTYIAGTM